MESDAHLSEILTEDTVKRRFVPFLKDFYRHRYEPLPNTVEVSFDNVTAEGFIADGLLRFMHPNGAPFICTYEATSKEKIDEVKFNLNINYFLWDCAAFGAAVTSAIYLISYASRPVWLMLLGWAGNLGLLLGTGMIGFLSWYFTMNKWRKYRYIFAVEQFKQYQADEQWVAIAADVFPAPTDPYLVELKNQCIYNGFGLAVVPEEGAVRVLNAPTRLQDYGRDRKMVEWITDREWFQRASQNFGTVARYRPPDQLTALWNQLTRPVRYLVVDPFRKFIWSAMSKPFGQTTSVYARFMEAHTIQKWIFFISLVLIAPFLWRTLERRNDRVDALAPQRTFKDENPEDYPNDLYLSGAAPVPFSNAPSGVPKQYPVKKEKGAVRPSTTSNGIEDETGVQTIQISNETDSKASPAAQPLKPATPAKKKAPKPSVGRTGDPCAFVQKNEGWIIQENIFSSQDNANARIQALLDLQLSCALVPRSCLEAGQKGYVVWIGPVYPSEAAARKDAKRFEKTLQQKKVSKGQWIIRKI